ncbi:MAG: hypothetical protein ACFFA6_06920 [Promethearchaeota archaeon]
MKKNKDRFGLMNINAKFMDETIRAIGYVIRFNYNSPISVKKLRNLYKIESVDKSKTNFYWRCLKSLEQNGILKRYGTKEPKKYQILNFFKFFELLHDSYVNQATLSQNSR